MNRRALFTCAAFATLALAVASPAAHADDEATSDAPATPTRKVKAKSPPKPAEPPAVPPSITLTVSPAPFPQPWTMRVENTGEIPLRLLADARLLALELASPGAKTSVRCELPASMRPSGDAERALVIPPKRAYAEAFDPRLYCFGDREAAALSAGANVLARLGFPVPAARARSKAPLTGPFVVAPIDGLEPRVSAAKEIVALPFALDATAALPSRAAAAESSTADAGAPAAPSSRFAVEMTPWIDAGTGADVDVVVTVTNTSPAPASVRLRPAALSFEIAGPSGAAWCAWGQRPGAPIRELMTTLPPRGRTSTSVLLSSLCPDGTFDDAGLYTIRVTVDANRLQGEGKANADEIAATLASFARIHKSRQPQPEERPKLQAP